MGLESVIQEVLDRGRAEGDEIRRAAAAERERMLQEARVEGAKLLVAREQDARQAAERARVQQLARAELESKKIVLASQKELLDRVYQTVLGKLGALSESSALLRSLLEANRTEWQAGRVFCNAKDAEVVRSIVGSNFGGTIDCIGGVVIESNDGTRKTDLRFETILSDVWRDSIKEVADALWPPQ